ncbi:hypothetical protein [Larkinella rosea]|uniref:Uncharacterized protein n=1 Tax=Larkinella rosea TaxID=2025312 RepID=A0A3P1BUV0_9BACT|nr:hypothetical protein [Larkinella rosea]RRB04880.1 hypothetical protein EHT25_15590 [Larkinella rosea]
MKKLLIASLIGLTFSSFAGKIADPNVYTSSLKTAMQQDTTKQKTNKIKMEDRMRRGQIEDRRPTGDPNPKQPRPDSLRRGGAMKVDTIQH